MSENLFLLILLAVLLLCSVAAVAVVFRLWRGEAKKLDDKQDELALVKADNAALEQQAQYIKDLQVELEETRIKLSSSETSDQLAKTELAAYQAKSQEQLKSQQDKLEFLESARRQLSLEFEKLASQLLDKKSEKFKESQESFFQNTMQPFKEQLSEFRQRVDKVYESESRDRVSLLHEIKQLKSLNQQMSDDAVNLTNALKGNQKFQGNWGEFVLEKVLESSGLRSGYEYELQAKRYDEEGQRRLPDVIVHLPDNKDIIIDSKVSLTDYQRYCEADGESEKAVALKGHLQSLSNHIKDLSGKNYESLEGVNTLDFVMMFIPLEAAFLLAMEKQPELFQAAYDKHIILVSPTTLLATLRTVENLWRYERQNKNAEEIARQAGALYDQCVLVTESISDVGKHLDRGREAYDQTLKRLQGGRGNVISRIEKLKKLGAKTKKVLATEFSATDDLALEQPEDNETPED